MITDRIGLHSVLLLLLITRAFFQTLKLPYSDWPISKSPSTSYNLLIEVLKTPRKAKHIYSKQFHCPVSSDIQITTNSNFKVFCIESKVYWTFLEEFVSFKKCEETVSSWFLLVNAWYSIINNYSPKWRWIVAVDIYLAAKTEVNNCFSIYHTSWKTSSPKSNFIS